MVDKKIKKVFGESNVIMEWLVDGKMMCVNTIEDMRRQINLVYMDAHLVDVGVSFYTQDLEVHVAKKLPIVDWRYKYVKYNAWDAPVFIFFKDQNMTNEDIEILM